MFTGVSGLLANAEGINVIGNNLANVNTIGFKDGRMLFSDMLSADIGKGSQIGRGTQIQKVDNIFSQGTFESTTSTTDLAIQGNSFFAVMDPNGTAPVNQNSALLTRAGAFRLDSNLYLVNADGYQVLDTQGNPIKFNDNSAEITAANTNVVTALTTAAAAIKPQADVQFTAATDVTKLVLDAAGASYNTEATSTSTAADTFANAVYKAAADAYAAQSATMATAATDFKAVVPTLPAVATDAETAAQAAILTAAESAKKFADTAAGNPTKTTVADAKAAFDALNTLTTSNSSVFTSSEIIDGLAIFKVALSTANSANSATAPAGEIAAATAIKDAATAAKTAGTTAGTASSAANVAAAKTAYDALTTLTSGSAFAATSFVTALDDFKKVLSEGNAANTLTARPDEITAAIAIRDAATVAKDAAATAVTAPGQGNNDTAQAALNTLTTLVNNSLFTTDAFATEYSTFKTGLNTANTAVNDAMATAAPLIAAAQTQLATAKGIAFSKIDSIDSSGLITYLGKDGITTNYYNASGQTGLAANAANAVTVQRLAVVTVANSNGLDKVGGTLFKSTTSSGVSSAAFSLATNSANGTSEAINTNSLEQSTVDMAAQFVKMILTQRAYSANSKTITTADEMTQEVISLKR
jgi:flagellar hook protein FlgE